MEEENNLQQINRIGYNALALYHISDGYVDYTVMGVSQSDALDNLRRHFKDVGMEEDLGDYDQIKMIPADEGLTIRFDDHDLKITLKAKEWSAIFDGSRPEWNLVACSEW